MGSSLEHPNFQFFFVSMSTRLQNALPSFSTSQLLLVTRQKPREKLLWMSGSLLYISLLSSILSSLALVIFNAFCGLQTYFKNIISMIASYSHQDGWCDTKNSPSLVAEVPSTTLKMMFPQLTMRWSNHTYNSWNAEAYEFFHYVSFWMKQDILPRWRKL